VLATIVPDVFGQSVFLVATKSCNENDPGAALLTGKICSAHVTADAKSRWLAFSFCVVSSCPDRDASSRPDLCSLPWNRAGVNGCGFSLPRFLDFSDYVQYNQSCGRMGDKIWTFLGHGFMVRKPRRVAVMLELEWPYKRHAGIFAGTQKYAQEHGWHSIIDEYAGDTLPAKKKGTDPVSRNGPKGAAQKRGPSPFSPYDGVIARATKTLAERGAKAHVPVVNVWYSSPVFDKLPGVFADFAAIGRMRAEHLLSRGLRRFATLTSTSEHAHRVELAAFRDKLHEAGFSCDSARIPLHVSSTLNQWRKTDQTIAALIEDWEPPIGVYVGMEMHGRLVAQVCQQRGWRVPEDVAIIAGWNEETYCEHLRPTLTSVEVGYERIGYEAARLLDRLMDEKENRKGKTERKPPEHILLPPEGLMVRESTDFVAVDDPLIAAALEFIAANCHLKIGQNDVADAVGMETRTLQRRFRKYLARPIAKQILHARLERAKREVAQTERSMTAISREVGFGPRERMYEVFTRELGVTPSQYRGERQLRRS